MKTSATFNQLKKKSVAILGFGREGWSTYQFIRQQLPNKQLALADAKDFAELPEDQQMAIQADERVTLLFGKNYLETIAEYELIFKTPGIPQSQPAIQNAIANGATLTSNAQLFFELCEGVTIGVTGTKGKSTTAAVIFQVLQTHGLDAVLAGNIGTPMLSVLEKINQDTLVVLELSAHQLETMTVSPNIAVIQQITSEHLDYFTDTAEYREAKSAIARWQTEEDVVIYNPEFDAVTKLAALSKGKHHRHSLEEGPDSVAFVRNEIIMARDPQQHVAEVITVKDLPLLGKHNVHNVMPAVVIGSLFGITAEEIGEALHKFTPLPHRLEFVAERNGQRYYDDSLATEPHAAVEALESFDGPIVLVAGGYERQQNFIQLAQKIIEKKVAGVVLFEPSGKRLKETLESIGQGSSLPPIEFAETMAEAVEKAQAMMPADGIMLMSPGSASFGRFEDYRDRGLQFQQAVKNLSD